MFLNNGCSPPASQDSHQHINAKNPCDEHQRTGPGLAMPIVIGRNCIRKNLQGKRRNGLTEAVVPKTITEGGEKKGGCFAAYASEVEQNSSDDTLRRSFHHDVNNRFPPADTQSERSFAISIRHKKNNFFGSAQDQWDHYQTERETAGVRRETFEPQDDQTVNDHPPGD